MDLIYVELPNVDGEKWKGMVKLRKFSRSNIPGMMNEIKIYSQVEDIKGILRMDFCLYYENWMLFLFEEVYVSFQNHLKGYREFHGKRNRLQRMINYKQIAENLLELHRKSIIHENLNIENILAKSDDFTSLRIFSFEHSSFKGNIVDDHYSKNSAPEMNTEEEIVASPK